MSHTPGPYRLVPPGGPQGPFWGLISAGGYVVATQIAGLDNAGLFQAAPDLLDALEAVLSAHGHIPTCLNDFEIHSCRPACSAARAAVAKAKGLEDS